MRRLTWGLVLVFAVLAGCTSTSTATASSTSTANSSIPSSSSAASSRAASAESISTPSTSQSPAWSASSAVVSSTTTARTTTTAVTSATGGSSTAGSSATSGPSINDSEAEQLPAFPTAPPTPQVTPSGSRSAVQQFLGSVFTDAQRDWARVFRAAGIPYRAATIKFFTGSVDSACGPASSDVGPFYCPGDLTVYIDVSFFTYMQQRFNVTGDFSMAYVVAHEVGHHIQTVTGISRQVAAAESQAPSKANQLSVLSELQADCYAGVWAYSTYRRGLLEPGDIEEALQAAGTVGDDFLQKASTGAVIAEQWTHGSSAQRQKWLTVGYQSGKPADCDTFSRGA